MSLQWVMCGAVAAFEAVLVLLVSIPTYRSIRLRVIPALTTLMQPLLAVVPFALFQLLDVYLKYEFSPKCDGPLCTSADHDRFEKKAAKNDRNFLLAFSALFLYWVLWRLCKLHGHILRLESELKRAKEQ
eukprot:TRINITY_DN7543_c0_g1_i1.p1 TRINITY_DN7543_c0_g1~~TRINITY_DN7543_c0_g1_i1.p1  ORF type:complete len:130 (-),score=15.96 TRINITY_DN7543_c0_g1_i1:216-605(-)